MELFERRQGNKLTLTAYQESGGVLGALAGRAEDLFAGLNARGQEVTRQLFLRLVTLGEGTEDTRRRVSRSELVSMADDQEILERVMDIYGRYRLLTFDHDPETRMPTVELAHEAILREWKRLRQWIETSRGDMRTQRNLTASATEWANAGKDASYLLRGKRLDQYEAWAAKGNLALTRTESAYLEASLIQRRERVATESARKAQ